MKNNRLIYFWIAALMCLASCSTEEPADAVRPNHKIRFAPTLPDITWTRAADVTIDNFYSFQATCFNPNDLKSIGPDGSILPYFEDITFGKVSSIFVAADSEELDWPGVNDSIDFFAFAPSRTAMAQASDISLADAPDNFKLINRSTAQPGKASYDYSLENICISSDIYRQFDFMTATAAGSKFSDSYETVTLPFNHRLARVELRVVQNNPNYNIEIAGVRLGNVVMQGTYTLSPKDASKLSDGFWTLPDNKLINKVEYLFNQQTDETQLADAIVAIGSGDDDDPDKSISIMGNGGAAMMIPMSSTAWDRTVDNRGTYFSVLLRLSLKDGKLMYPYPDEVQTMNKTWLAVSDNGLISTRLYKGKNDIFYTDEGCSAPYTAASDEQVKEFGWAALPIEIDWLQGQSYIYTIDYSEGVGVKDPEDSHPGELILGRGVNIDVTVTPWAQGDNTDLPVPRK